MKALSYRYRGEESYGLFAGGVIRPVSRELRQACPDLLALLQADRLAELPGQLGSGNLAPDDVDFLPVIPRPRKILCVGVNYRPHAEEMGRPLPEQPLLFVRFAASQVGHDQPLLHPGVSTQFDFEGELAVVIGKPAWRVPVPEAFDVIAGYSAFMDGSVRDWQRHTTQFTAGKNFRASGAMGPWLACREEVPDPAQLRLQTRVNGELMQDGQLSDLIFDIPALVAYCSTFALLEPGDVIVTGTPGGVGAARTPPRWLEPGDVVEVDLGPVGILRNTVAVP